MSTLFGKYVVTKANGEDVDPDAQYFVLRVDTDSDASWAVRDYAELIDEKDPELSKQIIEWLDKMDMDATFKRVEDAGGVVSNYRCGRAETMFCCRIDYQSSFVIGRSYDYGMAVSKATCEFYKLLQSDGNAV